MYQMSELNNGSTYKESVVLFVFILSGTFFYSLHREYEHAAILSVLVYGIALVALTFVRFYYDALQREKGVIIRVYPRALFGVWVWWAWLMYGTLLSHGFLPIAFSYLISTAIVVFVIVSYCNQLYSDEFCTHVAFAAFLVLVLIPHEYSIARLLDGWFLFGKVVVFYFKYILCGMETTLAKTHESELILPMTYDVRDHAPNKMQLKTLEMNVVRSAWSLLAPSYVVYATIPQFVLAIIAVYRLLPKNAVRQTSPNIHRKKKNANDHDSGNIGRKSGKVSSKNRRSDSPRRKEIQSNSFVAAITSEQEEFFRNILENP